ncbi:hypothetical protein C824_004222 [Schaedlerella arabinosiphila]|nr:hypothetical protein C824_004222 [Schaedlerella arabinosiphila]
MRSCSDVPANCPRRYTNMDSHQYYQNHHPTATSSPQSTSPHPTPPNSAPKKQHKKNTATPHTTSPSQICDMPVFFYIHFYIRFMPPALAPASSSHSLSFHLAFPAAIPMFIPPAIYKIRHLKCPTSAVRDQRAAFCQQIQHREIRHFIMIIVVSLFHFCD